MNKVDASLIKDSQELLDSILVTAKLVGYSIRTKIKRKKKFENGWGVNQTNTRYLLQKENQEIVFRVVTNEDRIFAVKFSSRQKFKTYGWKETAINSSEENGLHKELLEQIFKDILK